MEISASIRKLGYEHGLDMLQGASNRPREVRRACSSHLGGEGNPVKKAPSNDASVGSDHAVTARGFSAGREGGPAVYGNDRSNACSERNKSNDLTSARRRAFVQAEDLFIAWGKTARSVTSLWESLESGIKQGSIPW